MSHLCFDSSINCRFSLLSFYVLSYIALTQVSASKSCFYNDHFSYPEADKTLTDARFSYQYYYSSFDDHIKKSRSAEK